MKKGEMVIIKIFLSVIIIMCSCTNNKINYNVQNKIYFDTKLSVKNFDLKGIIDSAVTIIPLETRDDCLISRIDKLEIVDDRIYIQDILAQSIFIFDINGKFIDKLKRLGQGPGEYVNLSYMTVTDSTIIVVDHYARKQLEYSKNSLKFLRNVGDINTIWCTDIFSLSKNLYYINNWSDSKSGKYRLFAKKTGVDDIAKYLPFKKEPLALGLSGNKYGVFGNAASVIYDGDDYIYRIKENRVYPEFEMIYKNEKVVYTSGEVENVYKENSDDRVLGINSINESEKYLFLHMSLTGNNNYTCIYNKHDSTTIIYTSLAINSYLDDEGVNVMKIINNQVIDWRDAYNLFVLKKYVYSNKEFKNQKYKKQLDMLFQDLKEDSNPVLFIYDLI